MRSLPLILAPDPLFVACPPLGRSLVVRLLTAALISHKNERGKGPRCSTGGVEGVLNKKNSYWLRPRARPGPASRVEADQGTDPNQKQVALQNNGAYSSSEGGSAKGKSQKAERVTSVQRQQHQDKSMAAH